MNHPPKGKRKSCWNCAFSEVVLYGKYPGKIGPICQLEGTPNNARWCKEYIWGGEKKRGEG